MREGKVSWNNDLEPCPHSAGKSNSGEGGEDPVRWEVMNDVDAEGRHPSLPHLKGLQNGDLATSRIKQARSPPPPPLPGGP